MHQVDLAVAVAAVIVVLAAADTLVELEEPIIMLVEPVEASAKSSDRTSLRRSDSRRRAAVSTVPALGE